MLDGGVVLEQELRREHRVVRHQVVEWRGEDQLGGIDPARQRPAKAQRSTELEERRLARRVVGVDEPEVDLAFVAQARAIHGERVALDQRDGYPSTRELEGDSRSLEPCTEDHDFRGEGGHLEARLALGLSDGPTRNRGPKRSSLG